MSNVLSVSVYRYNPDVDKKPYMQDYTLNPADCAGSMVLDVLQVLKKQDPTLSFRRSCGEGVCGSDGMNINGRNGLACITPFTTLPQPIVIRPLPAFPVVRDLVVDLTQFYEQYESVEPYLKVKNLPEKEFIQSQEARAQLDGLYECVLCACCTSSCPSYWWNPDKFVGPAGLLWACRFIMDSRDMCQQERLENLEGLYRLFRCRSIMNCVDVCPKGLNPNEAIGKIRTKMLKQV